MDCFKGENMHKDLSKAFGRKCLAIGGASLRMIQLPEPKQMVTKPKSGSSNDGQRNKKRDY